MKTIFKIIMAPLAAYFGLNWAADNPMKMKYMRNQVDQKVESGYEFALFQFKRLQKYKEITRKEN